MYKECDLLVTHLMPFQLSSLKPSSALVEALACPTRGDTSALNEMEPAWIHLAAGRRRDRSRECALVNTLVAPSFTTKNPLDRTPKKFKKPQPPVNTRVNNLLLLRVTPQVRVGDHQRGHLPGGHPSSAFRLQPGYAPG